MFNNVRSQAGSSDNNNQQIEFSYDENSQLLDEFY
jgi:YD repeat-containing protein